MPRVICTLPNASKHINGVDFSTTTDGMAIISNEISAEQAEIFLSIPGYEPEPIAESVLLAVPAPAVEKLALVVEKAPEIVIPVEPVKLAPGKAPAKAKAPATEKAAETAEPAAETPPATPADDTTF